MDTTIFPDLFNPNDKRLNQLSRLADSSIAGEIDLEDCGGFYSNIY